MRELLQNRQIYSNHELQDFILQLETRYNVTDLSGKYSNAVNFSENQNVPFHKWFRYREGFSGNLVKELIRESGALKDDVIVILLVDRGPLRLLQHSEDIAVWG